MTDQLNSKNLVPFKKRRGAYSIPGMTGENEEHLIDQVDHDLSPEERRFIRHYVSYADTLLNSVPEPDLVPQENASSNSDTFSMPEGSRTTEIPEQKNEPGLKSTTDEAA